MNSKRLTPEENQTSMFGCTTEQLLRDDIVEFAERERHGTLTAGQLLDRWVVSIASDAQELIAFASNNDHRPLRLHACERAERLLNRVKFAVDERQTCEARIFNDVFCEVLKPADED